MNYKFKQFEIPEHMVDPINLYVNQGVLLSGFLEAIICNNLKGAVGRADDENIKNIPAFVDYFYNKAPSICWGSYEKMIIWQKCGGANGLIKKAEKKINEAKDE